MAEIELEKIEELLFPHKEIREVQDVLIRKIDNCIQNKSHLIAHAPTGLGKTAAALSPALTHILKDNQNLTIFFLTSRHTQHKIVLDTLKRINEKFGLNILGSSIIGKKNLCLQPGAEKMHSREFADFCRLLVDGGKCDFYNKVKNNGRLSPDTEVALRNLKSRNVASAESILNEGRSRGICHYEIGLLLAKDAKVIIADYQYIFNPSIRDNFFRKLNKELKDCILIIDEAHNLPSRIKDLDSEFLSSIQLKRAIAEAKKFNYEDIADHLSEIQGILERYSNSLKGSSMEKYERNSASLNVTLDSFSDA